MRIKYTSAAIPPIGIKTNSVYTVKYIVDNYNLNEEMLKAMFTPVDGNWDKPHKKKTKKHNVTKNTNSNETDDGAD